MTRRKGEERSERQVPNRFKLCDGGHIQRNLCVPKCVVEMDHERCLEWQRNLKNLCIHPHYPSKG